MGGIVLSKLLIVRHHTLEVNGGIRGRLTNLDAQCTKYWFAEGSQIASGAQTIPAVSFSIVTRRSSVQLIKSVLSQIKIALEPFAEAASQDAYCRISALLLLVSKSQEITHIINVQVRGDQVPLRSIFHISDDGDIPNGLLSQSRNENWFSTVDLGKSKRIVVVAESEKDTVFVRLPKDRQISDLVRIGLPRQQALKRSCCGESSRASCENANGRAKGTHVVSKHQMNMPTPEEIAIIPFCLYIHCFFCSTYIFPGTWGTDDELLAAIPVDLSIVADSSQHPQQNPGRRAGFRSEISRDAVCGVRSRGGRLTSHTVHFLFADFSPSSHRACRWE